MDAATTVTWVVAFVLLAVIITGLARRAGWSAPVLLVGVGAVISFIPGIPAVEVQPEFVLYGVLPPLLYAAAFGTSAFDIRKHRDTILLLSAGLVVVTAFAVGWVTFLLLPAIGFAAAFALAAVVAPTDASAVTAVAGRLQLPHRVVTVLEGESLHNDAIALVLLNSAVVVIAATPGPMPVAAELGMAVVAGAGIGLAVGWLLSQVRRRLTSPVLDTSLALITPYLAFIAAQAIHGSGVLAVVIAALFLGFRAPVVQSAEARVAEAVNWRTASFLVENAVFLFIGLNAAGIIRGAVTNDLIGFWGTVGLCAAVIGALYVTRFVFIFLMVGVFKHGPRYLRGQDLRWKNAAVISAANVRGVVTLAAIFLLPPETPGRELLQLVAFVVVVVSLLTGLFLPRLVRALRFGPPESSQEFTDWQLLMAQAQASGLARLEAEVTDNDHRRVVDQLRTDATLIAESIEHETNNPGEPLLATYRRLRRIMINAERAYVITARAEHRCSETVVAAALRAIDSEELVLRAAPHDTAAPAAPRDNEPAPTSAHHRAQRPRRAHTVGGNQS
jgi:CPA1 family monovalent cation:H+ antiporter